MVLNYYGIGGNDQTPSALEAEEKAYITQINNDNPWWVQQYHTNASTAHGLNCNQINKIIRNTCYPNTENTFGYYQYTEDDTNFSVSNVNLPKYAHDASEKAVYSVSVPYTYDAVGSVCPSVPVSVCQTSTGYCVTYTPDNGRYVGKTGGSGGDSMTGYDPHLHVAVFQADYPYQSINFDNSPWTYESCKLNPLLFFRPNNYNVTLDNVNVNSVNV